MKKYLLSLLAVILAIALTAYKSKENENIKEKALALINKTYTKKITNLSWCVFEYNGGPHWDPNSYSKVPYFVYLSEYCPGRIELCAILAEEDMFFNPGHPTQASLDYLLLYFGAYYFFPAEVAGLIEFSIGE